jgi:hypothetical protein
MDQPPEMRDRIYKAVLTFHGPGYPQSSQPMSIRFKLGKLLRHSQRQDGSGPDSVLSLLRVSCKVHQEAGDIFYRDNDLAFRSPLETSDFLSSLGLERLRAVRSVTLCDVWGTGDTTKRPQIQALFNTLRLLPQLRKLHIFANRGEYEPSYQRPMYIPQVEALFTFRSISDFNIRDSYLEDVTAIYHRPSGALISPDWYRSMLRHFNFGLALAQIGITTPQYQLCEDTAWPAENAVDLFSVLRNSTCSPVKHCTCPEISTGLVRA